MRFSLAILAAANLASCLVSASGLYPRQIPNCATSCITNADYGSCSPTDNACLCNNSAFVNGVSACIASSCTGSDLTTATSAAQALCAAAGVTLTGTLTPSTSGTPAATATSPAGTSASSTTGATPASTSNAALSNGVNALAGMAAFGLALAL